VSFEAMSNVLTERIGLGTVQFGLEYGISNTVGRTPSEEVTAILRFAESVGVQVLDTAPAYGESERILGTCLSENASFFRTVTKTPHLPENLSNEEKKRLLEKTFRSSLQNLALEKIYGILVHNAQDILGSDGARLWHLLESFRDQGFVEKIGVSVYDEIELQQAFELFPLELVQIPLNIFDQRLFQSGMLKKLKNARVEIHGRSCFLQGLLLMSPETLPPQFESVREMLRHLRELQQKHGLTPLEAALGFALGVDELDTVVVGVNTLMQFQEILASARALPSELFSGFAVVDTTIVEPRRWKCVL
jgi:aryl-alcohol dehydrogenase-like predicted oxidoreductase